MKQQYNIRKKFQFEMAHVLDGHDGKCKNLHGHSYVLQIELTGELIQEGPKKGMVMDFSALKVLVSELIISPMDHAFCYDETNKNELKIATVLQELALKIYAVPFRTTVENLAQHIFQIIKNQGIPISSVLLWETQDSCCEYRER